MNNNDCKKNDKANAQAERGQQLIAQGFRIYRTIPNAWVKSMNVPFIWHGFDWSDTAPAPEQAETSI